MAHIIYVSSNGEKHTFIYKTGKNLLEVLQQAGLSIPAPCGGNGTCGKCAVHVNGEKKLACTCEPRDGMEIKLPDKEAGFEVIQYYQWTQPPVPDSKNEGYGLAVDIGTTTLAFELFDLCNGMRVGAFSAVNSQRAIGADVITRIQQATQGKQIQLHHYIIKDINHAVKHLLNEAKISTDSLRRMVVAGNTTMLHLLHNQPCDTLGVFPFTPVEIGTQVFSLDTTPHCVITTLPGISTFVGADITAGIVCLAGAKTDETFLLIDLGTNGEMALVKNEKIFVTSTAAGPAFEAGNISRGIGSVAGAIAKANYDPNRNVFDYETIDNAHPVGICGTGVLDITAELARHGLIDETGRFENEAESIEVAPGIHFTQKDIREIQLAKSAVRAGIEILLETAGCNVGDIKNVYLAGGFGFRLNVKSAEVLGIFPTGLVEKVKAVGNTALGGAAKALLSTVYLTEAEKVANRATEVSLASHPRFNDLFMEYMLFPERAD